MLRRASSSQEWYRAKVSTTIEYQSLYGENGEEAHDVFHGARSGDWNLCLPRSESSIPRPSSFDCAENATMQTYQ